jgi:hypothetical protein
VAADNTLYRYWLPARDADFTDNLRSMSPMILTWMCAGSGTRPLSP